ncbi:MAG: hypothetical protein MUW56_07310 [Chryseobacterium sp.]|uniref:hypothetical protein n=1 Tax=Chryseobacterium sp. TaxID=1871047 RepID=UPI0025BCD70C|nr:hypothetical protein [Chryseobacterium sp.]MCJ7933433.1 hypothetical protein [Chryseobacterium sp.]
MLGYAKTLNVCRKVSNSIFLLKVSTFTEGEIYFVWLQRYISDVLDVEDPSWRSSKKDKILIKIPKHNKLSDKINKIIRIASKIKYVEELAEFLERINKINYDIKSGAIIDEKVCDSNIASLRRIKRLKTLLKYNNSSISSTSVDNLINHVIDIKTRNDDFEDLLNDEDNFNFNQLYKEITNLQFVENFEAENHFDTSY